MILEMKSTIVKLYFIVRNLINLRYYYYLTVHSNAILFITYVYYYRIYFNFITNLYYIPF